MSTSVAPFKSRSLPKPLCAASLAMLLAVAGALPALAAETTIEMQRIRESGPGPVIGKVQLADAPQGVALQIDLTELPPGPNRLFLHEGGDCSLPRGELLANPLAVVNVDITEGGAEPLKTTLVVPGTTLAEMTNKALVVYRGSQIADLSPLPTSQPRLVACGVIR